MITRQKKFLIVLSIIISAVIMVMGAELVTRSNQSYEDHQSKLVVNHSTIPVLFIHGWAGGLHSELPLAKKAIKVGVAQKGMIIYVGPSDQIKMTGHLPSHPKKSPEVLIKFPNAYIGEFKEATELHKILVLLKRNYHVNQYNAIGHSMGAYALVAQSEQYGHSSQIPLVNKLVLIAGPFDGILNRHKWDQPTNGKLSRLWDDYRGQNRLLSDGQPKIKHPEYQVLMKNRRHFPRQAKILNIFGRINSNAESDGTVSVPSVLSLGSILKNQVDSYKVRGFSGQLAKHTYLEPKNTRVQRTIMKFLWNKY
jgi:uncharacterized alpha/beta hydrolase family protein